MRIGFASVHGKAAPNAVLSTIFQVSVLIMPRDPPELRRHSEPASGFPGYLHIDPGKVLVVVQIEIR